MKTVILEEATLNGCVKDAQSERVVVTRDGKPIALVVGVEGMDVEQLQLSASGKFWTMVDARRKQKTVSRLKLEQMLSKRK